jgi:hypothetical protein
LSHGQNLRVTEESTDIYDLCVLKKSVITDLKLLTLAPSFCLNTFPVTLEFLCLFMQRISIVVSS